VCNVLQSHGMLSDSPVDLVLSCVDNYGARLAINRACLECNIPWMESGVSEDGISGHIQTLLPGITACFECLPPLAVASGIDESTIRRAGVCAASLPTVMGVIAGFLAQNALKFLLSFGEPCFYMSYASMTNYTTVDVLRPNIACSSALCCARQVSEKRRAEDALRPKTVAVTEVEHSSNEWGIQVTPSSDPIHLQADASGSAVLEDATDIETLMKELDQLNVSKT
jgi:ubiquitin-like modifier-activating enzyme 5